MRLEMLWKFTTLPAAMFLFCPVYASFGRRHSEATVFRVAEHAAGHTQVSSPTSAVPEAVHPQAPMVTEQVPSRETGSKQVANSPSVTLQGSTSRSVPPADTANRARLVEYIQIEDDSSDPGSPPPPSIVNSKPCIKPAGPSALPSCSSQPAPKLVYQQQRSSLPAVPVFQFPYSENQAISASGGLTNQVQPEEVGAPAAHPTKDDNHLTQHSSNTPMGFLLTEDGQTWRVPIPSVVYSQVDPTAQCERATGTSRNSGGKTAQPFQNTNQNLSFQQTGQLTSSDIKEMYQKISSNFNPQANLYQKTTSTSDTPHQAKPKNQNTSPRNQYPTHPPNDHPENPSIQARPDSQQQLAVYSNHKAQAGLTYTSPVTREATHSNPSSPCKHPNHFLQYPNHDQQQNIQGSQEMLTVHSDQGHQGISSDYPQGTASNPIVLNEEDTNQNFNQLNQIPEAQSRNGGTKSNHVDEALEQWVLERYDPLFKRKYGNSPSEGVPYPMAQIELDRKRTQIKNCLRYLYLSSPSLYERLQAEYENYVLLSHSCPQGSATSHPVIQPQISENLDQLSQCLEQTQNTLVGQPQQWEGGFQVGPSKPTPGFQLAPLSSKNVHSTQIAQYSAEPNNTLEAPPENEFNPEWLKYRHMYLEQFYKSMGTHQAGPSPSQRGPVSPFNDSQAQISQNKDQLTPLQQVLKETNQAQGRKDNLHHGQEQVPNLSYNHQENTSQSINSPNPDPANIHQVDHHFYPQNKLSNRTKRKVVEILDDDDD
ncbi:hypothetical protein PGTUg99_014890 [Puccinia graminis f. sp. tritici]|uniref:Uncharacterized protein n=2 Tax=Puccinia graminis f. sp. tritici TaxID=56615 RepID=A0A5B0NYA0_PUCGR|nr:hypothetical protein PGTUg99_014890 [Puccinia graminis f. sp. tritici]